MKTSKSLLTKLLLFFFLEVQHLQYFLQQILNFKLLFVFYLKISLWGPKSEVPAHFVLKAQSPGQGALLLRTHNESSLKVQGCGRGRLYAQHLTNA